MGLAASCPRCASPLTSEEGEWRCPDHGAITPMWKPYIASYDALTEHLRQSGSIPTLLQWPLNPGWAITDFGCVAYPDADARATVISSAGPTPLDGIVKVTVVAEEPGVGLGACCAGVDRTDPGAEIRDAPPLVKVRIDGHPISLWSVSTSNSSSDFDRSVFAGEAHGRWLWLVLRPASAALLLNEGWTLYDVAGLGKGLIQMAFGGNPQPG